MKYATLILTAILFAFPCQAEDRKGLEEHQLSYIFATDAFAMLGNSFPGIQDIVRSIDLERNRLVLNSNHPDFSKVLDALKGIDQRPREIRLESAVTLIAPDGREKVLTKPTLYTVEGKTVEIWLGEYDGAKLKLTVTPVVVEE